MSGWIDALRAERAAGRAAVLVTVVGAKGSTPREAGTKMVVGADRIHGTIGGGHLEFQATRIAREMAAAGAFASEIRTFPLGPSLGQCCGGRVRLAFEAVAAGAAADWLDTLADAAARGEPAVLVTRTGPGSAAGAKRAVTRTDAVGSLGERNLDQRATALAREMLLGPDEDHAPREVAAGEAILLIEPIREHGFPVVLFGAGHVGRALVTVLAGLDCRVLWVDERTEEFPADRPAGISVEVAEAPEDEVDRAPAGSTFLVMTHSHDLDLRLSERILRRGDFRYLGLIGSATKRRRFERRLAAKGIPAETIGRLVCPIGIAGIPGKRPGEIAVGVAAELLRLWAQEDAADGLDKRTLSA